MHSNFFHIHHNTDIEFYKGSALFSITENLAKYLLEKENEIRNRKWSLAADECFIQSMIMNSPYKDTIRDIGKSESNNARLIDRTRPDGKNSPHIWRNYELDLILGQPEDICFARKFDERVDMRIVQILEHKIKK